MLIEEIKNIESNTKDLKIFGITIGFILLLFGIFFWFNNNDIYVYLLIFSALFLIISLTFPAILRPLQKLWMGAALIIGYIISRIILSIFFYFVITPVALILRLSKRNFLDIKLKDKESYWILKDEKVNDKSSYEKQY